MSHRKAFKTRPIASKDATIGGRDVPYRFQILANGLIRYEYAADCIFEDRASTFAIYREQPVPDFKLLDNEHGLRISTSRFDMYYDKKPFSSSGLRVQLRDHVSNSSSLWRYGYHHDEQRYALGGTVRTLDLVDGRVPLGSGVIAKNGYASMDDSDSMLFTEEGWVSGRRPPANGPRIDGYLFVYGHDYLQALKALYRISGAQPILPRWALGNWWSKNFKYSADSYKDLVDRFSQERIPLSVAVLDMKWHWVEEDMVKKAGASGWTGYSWNTQLFKHPKQFISEMHDRRLKITVCDHPSEGIANYEDVYQQVCRAVGQDPALGQTVPFDITNQDYTNAYFDIVLKKLEDDGVDFFWQDWQQGHFSSLEGCDPLWVLNHFHYLNMQKDGRRPFIFSRFAGPGSHRYPLGFSGDTIITWESLEFQPEFTATASNIGFGWWSNDIGGFKDGYQDDELLVRWFQFGLFSPIFRLHSANNVWMSKEPWNAPLEARAAQTAVMRWRHRLVPYLYSMNIRASRDLEPLVQPVYYQYPERSEAYRYRNSFFFGSELFIAPLTSKRDTVTQRSSVTFWLPPGRHVDFFTGTVYDGDRQTAIHRRLDEMGAFATEGAIIPLDGAEMPEFGCAAPEHVEVRIVVGADGSFDLHEDDGTGSTADDVPIVTTPLRWLQNNGMVRVTPPSLPSAAVLAKRSWTFTILGYRARRDAIPHATVDGRSVSIETRTAGFGMQYLFGSVPSSSLIELRIGEEDPQLGTNDVAELVAPRLAEAQSMYYQKKFAWATATASTFNDYGLVAGNAQDHSVGRRIAGLSALGLPSSLMGGLVEVMTADRRVEEELAATARERNRRL